MPSTSNSINCIKSDCTRQATRKKLCKKHYTSDKANGLLPGNTCLVSSCGKGVEGRGLCRQHYRLQPDLRKQATAYNLQRRRQNPEPYRESVRRYRLRNREKLDLYIAQWHASDNPKAIRWRFATSLRNRLRSALKATKAVKVGSAVRDLGCTIDELKTYLESKFQPGMTWENYGNKKGIKCWHIDHIKPLVSFDLNDRQQLLIACHFSNLQPLWADQNLKKGSKY